MSLTIRPCDKVKRQKRESALMIPQAALRQQTPVRSLAALVILFSLLGLTSAQGDDAWTEEPWGDALVSSDQSTSAMPNLLPFNVTEGEPQAVLMAGSDVNYTEYASQKRQNELWVRNNLTWTQYISAYQGERIDFVAFTPRGGSADLYRIYYSSGNISHKGYNIFPGYYSMNLSTNELGRMMLIFAVNSQPANAVIIDVLPREAEAESGPVAVESLLTKKARIVIQSDKVWGYDVLVDGAFYSSDIGDGTVDGGAGFTIGEGMHTITISKRESPDRTTSKSEHKKYFKGGYTYTLKA